MKFHILTLAFDPAKGIFDTQELDQFCAQSHILSHTAACIQVQGQAYWSVWLCYEPIAVPSAPRTQSKIDLSLLNVKQQACYQALQQWRNQRAVKEGFPPYIIASNIQLREIAMQGSQTISELLMIRGIGKQKAAKYGQAILSILQQHRSS